MSNTNERWFQTENIKAACIIARPKTVLDVGYPQDITVTASLYECAVVKTVDPYVADADYRVKFEDYDGPKADIVIMSSVLDYLENPVAGIIKAGEVGDFVLIQGRLNTYAHHKFKTHWWTPTKQCVEEQFPKYLPDHSVVWCKFHAYQMFSIFWRRNG